MSMYNILIFLVTYLICSINPAIEICKKKTGEDIRKLGSGNAGTANAMRVLGRVLGTLVILLDILKVIISFKLVTFIAQNFTDNMDLTYKSIFIVAAVIGHVYPIYYKFKGGKGVIVGITSAILLEPKIAIVCIIAGIIVILVTRTLALGTLAGVILYLIMTIVMTLEYLVPVIIVSLIISFKHRANIQRILTKQETKLW